MSEEERVPEHAEPILSVSSHRHAHREEFEARPSTTTAPSPSAPAESDLGALEARVREVQEVNERVMAQNVVLLHEVEVMQRQVAALRQEKAALAEQLRLAQRD